MKTFAMAGAAAMLLTAGTAAAQELPPQAEVAQEAAPAATYTDEQIASFVDAAVAMRAAQAEIAADATVTAEARQARALEVLAQAGIEPDTYNAIGAAMQTDPALAQRVQLALGARAPATQGNDNS